MNSVSPLRTLLVLGRGSNLPTVWSNCLAGWWLTGGHNYWKLPFLLLGVSALYTAGMFLNDAFDADFDRQRRPERPIPSGKVDVNAVWRMGFSLLGIGFVLLLPLGWVALIATLCLIVFIVLYDFTHKFLVASPWLMGACRFWVYIIAGTTGVDHLNGYPIACGFALALYIVGLSFVARRESFNGPVPLWPLLFLVAPIILALAMNTGVYRQHAAWVILVLAIWIFRCIRPVFSGGPINVGWTVSNLLAGIVFVDWLAVVPQIPPLPGVLFLALFAATKWLQKFVPAT